MTQEQKDALWDKHCIQGDEYDSTDKMFYECFMDAADEVYQMGVYDGREEMELTDNAKKCLKDNGFFDEEDEE